MRKKPGKHLSDESETRIYFTVTIRLLQQHGFIVVATRIYYCVRLVMSLSTLSHAVREFSDIML